MRLSSGLAKTNGIARVSTVAAAATAASTIVSVCGLIEFSSSWSIGGRFLCASEVEVDHLLHHQHADRHPDGGGRQHQVTERIGEQQRDVVVAGQIDERH